MLTSKEMLQAQAENVLPDPPDKLREMLAKHIPVVFMESREELATTLEVLVGTLRAAVKARLPKGCVAQLEEIMLGGCFDVFWKALAGEPTARVAPVRVTLKQGGYLSQIEAGTRGYLLEKKT